MNFREIQDTYNSLKVQFSAGNLSWADFCARVNSMRVKDEHGRWWQIDPMSGKWMFWNGTTWEISEQVSNPTPVGMGGVQNEGKLSVLQTFKDEKNVPLKQRSSKWWDSASIIGGIIAGLVWFLYSSAFSIKYLIRNHTWPRGDTPDYITPIIIAAMPVLFMVLRKPIDKLLLPLKLVFKPIPRLILIGIAFAVPIIVAIVLYNFVGLREYKYLRACVVLGSIASYAILRAPQAS